MHRPINKIIAFVIILVLIGIIRKPGIYNEINTQLMDTLFEAGNKQENNIKSEKIDKREEGLINTDSSTLTTEAIIEETNKERVKEGLPELRMNTKLNASSQIKTRDMIKNQYFEHVSPKGVAVSDLGAEVGYNYVIMGENLALGNFTDAKDVVQAWMNSPGHKANILNVNYQEMGAFALQASYKGREVWFVVQHFGTNSNSCPLIDHDLKVKIDEMNKNLRSKQAQISNEKALLERPDRVNDENYKKDVNHFNMLVSEYNNEFVISQDNINKYNKQVTAFNKCITRYQVNNTVE